MKKVLIATTNKDKFTIVSTIFKNTIFPENEYEIIRPTSDIKLPSITEEGTNIQRARTKALNAYEYLKNYNYDYIVGLDDALFIKGRIEPNIKNHLNIILYGNYLEDGEQFAFNRAYCIIDKEKNLYEVSLDIPEIYHPLKENIVIEDNTYPLSNVSYPIGFDKPLCELSNDEIIDYSLKYVKEGLMSLNIK
ncbi:MAG: hypothetical protein IKR74_00830 [Bacilli bacterium]|nr:hypothetical protein [Bacilli bacterium]